MMTIVVNDKNIDVVVDYVYVTQKGKVATAKISLDVARKLTEYELEKLGDYIGECLNKR